MFRSSRSWRSGTAGLFFGLAPGLAVGPGGVARAAVVVAVGRPGPSGSRAGRGPDGTDVLPEGPPARPDQQGRGAGARREPARRRRDCPGRLARARRCPGAGDSPRYPGDPRAERGGREPHPAAIDQRRRAAAPGRQRTPEDGPARGRLECVALDPEPRPLGDQRAGSRSLAARPSHPGPDDLHGPGRGADRRRACRASAARGRRRAAHPRHRHVRTGTSRPSPR